MNSKLKEFLNSLLPERMKEEFNKKYFERDRTSPEVKIFATHLYAVGNLSLRDLEGLLQDFGVRVRHVSIWRWVQRLGERLKDKAFRKSERRALVVDETKIRVQGGWIWILAAIDQENREIVGLRVSEHREMMDVLIFLKQCLKYYESKPVLITDGGPWYRWPAQRLGLEHVVLPGEERNYIERWFETLKDRLRAFDCYFPTERLATVRNFTGIFCLWYNQCRYHVTLKGPPAGGEKGLKKWMMVLSYTL